MLFGLIAPFIAPLFFPKSDPIIAIVLMYLPFGLIARPLGAIFWGYLEMRVGKKMVLHLTILGTSCSMLATAFLPTYQTLGIASAVLLYFKRSMTCFFAAGEGTGASLLLLENTPKKWRNMMSSFYEMSSMLGALLASLVITFMCVNHCVLDYWRLVFALSGLIGLVGFWLRIGSLPPKQSQKPTPHRSLWTTLKENALAFIAIFAVVGFLYANFQFATQLMNAYLPIITPLKASQTMISHSVLLTLDLCLLPLFGYCSKKVGHQKMIYLALMCALVFTFPLMHLVTTYPSMTTMMIFRTALILWGLAIAAPFCNWSMELLQEQDRYRIITLSRAFGTQLLGAPAISLSLILYKKTLFKDSPAFYLVGCCLVCLMSMYAIQKRKDKATAAFS